MAADIAALQARFDAVPTSRSLAMQIERLGEGEAVLSAPYTSQWDGIFQSFHGGLLTALADTAACWAVLTLTGAEAKVATTDISIRFLAPCRSRVYAKANVMKFGRTLCPCTVWLRDAEGREVAFAQVTYIRLG
jgi:uncharacterized protein (TIGR00369 family)